MAEFSLDSSTGSLTPTKQASVTAGTTPVRVTSDPASKFLYVANQGSNNVSAYAIANDGSLTMIAGSPFSVGGPGIDVAVSVSGKFLYVAEGTKNGTSGISAFSIGSSGALTAVAGSPFSLQNTPTAIVIDPSGQFLYVAAGKIEAFSIDANNGALTPVPGSPFQPVGPASCPTCAGPTIAFNLAIDASGKHLYTADSFAGSIDAFNIDPTTGALTHMSGAPFVDRMPTGQPMDPAFNPYGIAVDPSGKFLFGYDSGDQDISIFPIDATTGALGAVQKTGNTNGGVCAGQLVKVDPSGKFLYGLGAQMARCVGGEAIIGFSINPSDGALTPLPNEPFPATVVPFTDGIAIVP